VRDARYVPFGFRIQHINAEWCNYYLTCKNEKTGNSIRFGIEYDETFAAPRPVAYWFVRATAGEWATQSPVQYYGNTTDNCVRIPAEDIIHYAKFDDDADVTRPVPWTTPVMSDVRQLAKAIEAVVVAMRVGACSNVFFETDLMGPDGTTAAGADPDIMKGLSMQMNPGGAHGLPPGVRAKEFNPNQPNPNTGVVRNEILRGICAGLPGAQFSTIGQNYAEINFSAGRLERLTITAHWMMLQEFDIAIAERRIFSEWLKMALITGDIPLPMEKFWKFNQPKFTGRRWEGVDPIKEANAKALNLANKFTSPQRIHDEQGTDLEQTCVEIQESAMIYAHYGIESATTKGPLEAEDEEDEDESEPKQPTKEQE
jgi:lambda family phage portal protein